MGACTLSESPGRGILNFPLPASPGGRIIYTDGSCLRNPGGRGGYAVVLAPDDFIARGFRSTTNNRMELMAVLHALEISEGDVLIHSDSQYVVRGAMEWLGNWIRQGWRNSGGLVKNRDLWERYAALRRPGARLVWVRGHAGSPLNELADRKAVEAASRAWQELEIDGGYR